MKLRQRLGLLVRLGEYMAGSEPEWIAAKHKAFLDNNWFIPEFIDLSVRNITQNYLSSTALEGLIQTYHLPEENSSPKKVGIVMAGNIPLVGIHDLICVFMTGHLALVKASTKDDVLIRHLAGKLAEWDGQAAELVTLSPMLKNCDAYIATGSNNSSRYFEYYFQKYPTIIRKNRTSVAILDGSETPEELAALADDVYQYFGLGCRNVTKLYVPQGYEFLPLLEAFRKYDFLINHHKYKNNYDYNLAVHILNNRYYMTNGSLILVEDPGLFSAIGQVHFEFYSNLGEVRLRLLQDDNVQAVVGRHELAFGTAQCPSLTQYADGVDTIRFLLQLSELSGTTG